MKDLTFCLLALFFIMSCSNEKEKSLEENSLMIDHLLSALQEKGLEVSNSTQGTLLNAVAKAMQEGGTENAVAYCSKQAYPLLDSISMAEGYDICRISKKNRNPANALSTEMDQSIWSYYESNPSVKKDTLLMNEELNNIYHRPIHLGMSTCLKCHGERGSDIDSTTYQLIHELYPTDKAIDYKLGELRGLWKRDFGK